MLTPANQGVEAQGMAWETAFDVGASPSQLREISEPGRTGGFVSAQTTSLKVSEVGIPIAMAKCPVIENKDSAMVTRFGRKRWELRPGG